MPQNHHRRLLVFIIFLATFFAEKKLIAGENQAAPITDARLFFEENKNQWPSQVRYKVDIPGGNLFLEQNTLTYQLIENVDFHGFSRPNNSQDDIIVHSHAWKVKFENSSAEVNIHGETPYSFVNNYYHGSDPAQWAENVRSFESVKYDGIYKNIDINFYASEKNLKYDFIVHPGGDYRKIRMSYEGADEMHLEYGHLYIKTSLGVVLEQKPFAYQVINGIKTEVRCKYILEGSKVSFSIKGNYDETLPLVIDPTLIAATYTGSTADNWGFTATYDEAGNIYSGGVACAFGYPVSAGAAQTTFGGGGSGGNVYPFDIAIIKYNPTGTAKIFGTYFGGTDNEQPHSMYVNSSDELYITGRTWSANFPTTVGAYDRTANGAADIIVAKFSSTGALLASTFVGGSADDGVNYNAGWYAFGQTKFSYADDGRSEIVLDGASNVYVAASTKSSNFPTSGGAVDASLGGPQDGCVFKMNSGLTALTFSTYLGGNTFDAAYGLKVDNTTGNVYVTGGTCSSDFPATPGVIHPTFQGGTTDGFITELNSSGTAIVASTFLGTSSNDQSYFLERDASNNIYVLGLTSGPYPVTAGVYKNANSAQFIHKLNGSLTSTVFSTVIGTGSLNPNISPTAFLVDSCESIYLAGWGRCADFQNPNPNTVFGMPVTANAQQPTTDGCDFYFMVLTPNAKALWYGTFYGQNGGPEPDHVDGGTSRFDRRAFIYESVCASCGGAQGFPTTTPAWSKSNNSSNCNNAVIKMDVSVHPIAKANLNGPTVGCAPFTVPFNTTGSSASDYIWNFGDGSPSDTVKSTAHTYTAVGTYSVTLFAIDSLGVCIYIDSAKLVLKVGLPPVLQMSETDPKCFGGSDGTATVTATGGLGQLTYLWSPPASQSTSVATGLVPGNYSVTVKDSVGCTSKDTISVISPPVGGGSIIDSSNVTCFAGNDGTATANGPTIVSYVWNTLPVQSGPVASNLVAGSYIVLMTDANSCTATDSVIITEPPAMNLPVSTTKCNCGVLDGTAIIHPSGGSAPYKYLWLTNPIQTTNSATGLGLGTYSVVITDAKGCFQVQQVSIQSVPPPQANFYYTPSFVSYLDPNVSFMDASTGYPYYWAWNFGDIVSGDKDTSSLQNPLHLYSDTGQYCITLIVFDSTKVCRDTAVKCLKIEPEFTFFIPNAFTPNKDGVNELFFGYGTYIKKFHIMIFDRWGNLIFESNDLYKGWDGKVQGGRSGEPVQEDVYVWKVDLIDVQDKQHNYIGHVTKVK